MKIRNIKKEELISLLTQQGLLLKDICRELKISMGTLRKKFKEFNIISTNFSNFRAKYLRKKKRAPMVFA